MSDQLMKQLSALGVTNKTRAGHALLRAVELGYVTELRCAMPQCKRGDDRRSDFDPYGRPLSEWMWSVEHIVSKAEGGRLSPDNVMLAHRKCNQDDAVNRGRPVRVVTWNMGLARESRGRPWVHDQAWHYLLALGPDLAFVQEALPPAWARSEGAIVQGPFRQWGSAIFSPRFPLQPFRLADESPLRSLGSYLAFGTVLLPHGSESLVASVHAVVKPATRAQVRSLGSGSARESGDSRRDSLRRLHRVARIAPFRTAGLLAGETLGCGQRFGLVPIAGDRVYWYATDNVPEGGCEESERAKVRLAGMFSRWHAPIPALIQATPAAAILRNDISDRDPVDRWGAGGVTLLGDAAHPMTPISVRAAARRLRTRWCWRAVWEKAARSGVTAPL